MLLKFQVVYELQIAAWHFKWISGRPHERDDRPWADIRNISHLSSVGTPTTLALPVAPDAGSPIIEATHLVQTPTGESELIALPKSGHTHMSNAFVRCATAKD